MPCTVRVDPFSRYSVRGPSTQSPCLAAAAAGQPPSWIVAHSYHVGPAALSVGPRVWIDFHNLDSEIWRQTGEAA